MVYTYTVIHCSVICIMASLGKYDIPTNFKVPTSSSRQFLMLKTSNFETRVTGFTIMSFCVCLVNGTSYYLQDDFSICDIV